MVFKNGKKMHNFTKTQGVDCLKKSFISARPETRRKNLTVYQLIFTQLIC
jgi:hypothetical protein